MINMNRDKRVGRGGVYGRGGLSLRAMTPNSQSIQG